jgi:hypothetical protein
MARSGNALHEAGCMLYWAAGSKDRNSVQFVNSDVHMIRFFMRFLTECFGVTAERYCFSVNCYINEDGLTLEAIEAHWLNLLELPRACLRKAIVNNRRLRPSAGSATFPTGPGD